MSRRQRRALSASLLSLDLIAALSVPIYLGAFGFAAPEQATAASYPLSKPYDIDDPAAGLPEGYVLPVKPMPESYMCGPAVLGRILRKWGDDAKPTDLASVARTTVETGTSLAGLRDAAQARGVLTSGVELDYAALEYQVRSQNVAVIAHVNPAHYYWVRHADAAGVAITDQSSPASRWMPRAEFEAMWSGHALLVMRPTRNLSRTR